MFLPTLLVIIGGALMFNVGATSIKNEGEKNSNEAIAIGKRDIVDTEGLANAIQESLENVEVDSVCLAEGCGPFVPNPYLCSALCDQPNVTNFQAMLALVENCLQFCGFGNQFAIVGAPFDIPLITAVNSYTCSIQSQGFSITTSYQAFGVDDTLSDDQACYSVTHAYGLTGNGLTVSCNPVSGCPNPQVPIDNQLVALDIAVTALYSVCVLYKNGARTVSVALSWVDIAYIPSLDLPPPFDQAVKATLEDGVKFFLETCFISKVIILGIAGVLRQLLYVLFGIICPEI